MTRQTNRVPSNKKKLVEVAVGRYVGGGFARGCVNSLSLYRKLTQRGRCHPVKQSVSVKIKRR